METNSNLYWIALQTLFRSTPRKAREAVEHYGDADRAWAALREDGMGECLSKARQELDFVSQHGISVWNYRDPQYPYRLRECMDAPILLFGKGNIDANSGKMVSIVGTRQATERGKELTTQLVRDLARLVPDVTIVSGLAYGIDVAAHRAALEAGLSTLIIPAHGLDRIYPALHRNVAVASLQKGGILTEYNSGTEPERWNFVARNRIVAGMADALVVVESKVRGGSMISAQLALDYGRDVFTFPGRPTDENSRGCNMLIRNNQAQLIESAEDIVKAMAWGEETKAQPLQTTMLDLMADITPLQQRLVELLRSSEDGMHVNQLVQESGEAYARVVSELGVLELEDIVRSLPGGIYRALK